MGTGLIGLAVATEWSTVAAFCMMGLLLTYLAMRPSQSSRDAPARLQRPRIIAAFWAVAVWVIVFPYPLDDALHIRLADSQRLDRVIAHGRATSFDLRSLWSAEAELAIDAGIRLGCDWQVDFRAFSQGNRTSVCNRGLVVLSPTELRSGPGLEHGVVGSVIEEQPLSLTAYSRRVDDWVNVTGGQLAGWVHSDQLIVSRSGVTQPRTLILLDATPLRVQPEAEPTVATLDGGARVAWMGARRGGWVGVASASGEGWLLATGARPEYPDELARRTLRFAWLAAEAIEPFFGGALEISDRLLDFLVGFALSLAARLGMWASTSSVLFLSIRLSLSLQFFATRFHEQLYEALASTVPSDVVPAAMFIVVTAVLAFLAAEAAGNVTLQALRRAVAR